MGVRCWNHVINSYSELSCIFYSLTFGVDMKYMSMLDIWNQSFYVFLLLESVQRSLLSTSVSSFASVLLLFVFFPTRTEGGSFCFQEEKWICLHAMNAKQKTKKISMVWYSRITSWSDIKKRHQHPHGLRGGFKCQIKYECQILVPVDMNIVLI